MRQKVYPWLRDECYEDDEYEKRHWWNRNINIINDDYYWVKKIAAKIGACALRFLRVMKIAVELLIIDNMDGVS